MIKGLAITPPVVGRISIGRLIEKNGKRLPEKDDQFTITTQVQQRDGWLLHPLDRKFREMGEGKKLRLIPVNLLFNSPELNFRAEYTLFDRQSGRPTCSGDGEQCRRLTPNGLEQLPCPSASYCELAAGGKCKPYGRLYVSLGGEDSLGSFILRTTGYNTIRTIMARLRYYQAVSGDLLACMPLALRLRGKSTTQSHRTPIYYVDLTVMEGLSLEEAIDQARSLNEQRKAAGYDQQALDNAASAGISNAAFDVTEEEGAAIVEEFYPPEATQLNSSSTIVKPINNNEISNNMHTYTQTNDLHHPHSLKEKLAQQPRVTAT